MRALLVVLAVLALLPLSASEPIQVGSNAEVVVFVRERIQPLLVTHCFECHGNGMRKGHIKLDNLEVMFRSEGDFGPLLVPWHPEKSSLIHSVRYIGDDDINMPPKGKLPQADIDDLTKWVAMGAPWVPLQAATAATVATLATATGSASSATSSPSMVTSTTSTNRPPFVGRLHPVVVHLPIGVLVAAVFLELLVLLGLVERRAVTGALVLATLGGIAAVLSGTNLAGDQAPALLERHERLGWIAAAATLSCLALDLGLYRRPAAWRWLLRALLLAALVLVGLAGHTGGEMAWGTDWL